MEKGKGRPGRQNCILGGVRVKNTFSHTICAFAATSKAAIGFADRHKKIRNGDYYEKDKAIAVSAAGCTDADLLHPAERMGS